MDYILLNDEKTKISRLSLGTWAFSNAKLWGKCDQKAAIETIHGALDYGINLFDTSEKYGDGEAERILGEALKGMRQTAIVATKVYSDHLDYNSLIASCNASLKRLQTDYIDILQIHWPNDNIPVDETFKAFEYLKKSGKIRMISVCNHGIKCLERIAEYDVVMNQLPYSLLWRIAERQISSLIVKKKILIWAYSPLAQGLLTGKFKTLEDVPMERRANRMFDSKWGEGRHTDGGFEKEIFEFLDKLRLLCNETGFSMPALALNYLKSKENVGSILIGSRTISQLAENIKSYETLIPDIVISKLDEMSTELLNKMGDNADLWENGTNILGKSGRIY